MAGLQDDELDISHVAAPAPAPPPPAPAPRGGRLSEGELPDPIMAELAHGRGESTEAPPAAPTQPAAAMGRRVSRGSSLSGRRGFFVRR